MEAICILDFEQREEERNKRKTQAIFHEFYGVWFHGKLAEVLRLFACERFGKELDKRMHVFIEPEKVEKDGPVISDGIHTVTVYSYECRLYKWMAQGYHRGLVVLVDDKLGNAEAQAYFESRSWSFMMEEQERKRITEIMEQY